MHLTDKVIVVTGGARGIGRALCQRFARERPRAIVVADIDRAGADDVAASVGGLAVTCDVGRETEVERLVDLAKAQFGPIDLFCANAGVACAGGLSVTDEDWLRVMQINFMSHVYSARAVVRDMLARGSGYLLHTASAAGLLTQIGSAPYAVSKHAAVAFAEWLAVTYGDRGLRVSCLCPQGVLTDMLDGDDPILEMLRETAISADQVADAVVAGLAAEQFLILPHPEVVQYMRQKAADPDRWLSGMRRWQQKLAALRSARDHDV